MKTLHDVLFILGFILLCSIPENNSLAANLWWGFFIIITWGAVGIIHLRTPQDKENYVRNNK
jgi:hypothetical protein